jgi:hypothetical protein
MSVARARLAFALAILCCLTACSPSAEIAGRATGIADRAREDDAAWTRVGDGKANLPVEARAGRARATATIDDAHTIARLLTGVEDQHPVLNVVIWVAGAVVALAVIVLLWQTGLGTAIRIAVGWLPRKKVASAELAADMLDDTRPEKDREMVAAMRASDPEFDAAFRKAQTRRKAPNAG